MNHGLRHVLGREAGAWGLGTRLRTRPGRTAASAPSPERLPKLFTTATHIDSPISSNSLGYLNYKHTTKTRTAQTQATPRNLIWRWR